MFIQKEYQRKWYLKHKQQHNKRSKKYYLKNKKKVQKNSRIWYLNHLWASHYKNAKQRCNNLTHISFPYYGGKGIKLLMSIDDFKYLWFKDKAYKLKRPSIDRIDNSGNYELSNCKFIELHENQKKGNLCEYNSKG